MSIFSLNWIIILWILIVPGFTPDETDVCLSNDEAKLYELINEYRDDHGLPPVPLSHSLTIVAQQHSRDMVFNKPDKRNKCNMHSWSGEGDWTPCCYTEDHAKAECMWLKPAELTDYEGHGYEIAFGNANSNYDAAGVNPVQAMKSWAGSKSHLAVIINKGIWNDVEWKAMGVGIHKGFACVWFGAEEDTNPAPRKCSP